MAKTKEQKKEILERLQDAFTTSLSTVFVHFNGLSVGEETALRGALRSDEVSYFVAKKTLMGVALDEIKTEGDRPELEGEIAIAYGKSDPTAPARGVHAFVKKYEDKLSIVGGIFEGRYMDAAEMNEIATIPPMDTLRGMFANVINSPIQGLVVALSAVAEKKEA
ncbi:50S ribosomal protein L10 [Candidatus Kaiserbacteria bacterium]|nr:MAG: 50S ribosomal protein L10 [Candidatus Kaiserbacteria bacterium]